jgi:L-fuconolactonase
VIVDSHVYCFEPADAPAGHASGAEHLRWLQAAHAGHHQPAWRLRDRAPVSSRVLDPEGRHDLARLPEVGFRADRQRGRVVWTAEGEDCTKQFFPPDLRDLEYTPHSLISEMDYAGVDAALLHTDPMLGRDSAFLGECVRLYPDRLRAMAPVDEWRIRTQPDQVIGELRRAIEVHGLHAVKFIPPLAYLDGPAPWDDGPYRPFWEAALSFGVPIFFTLGTGPDELSGQERSPAQQRQGYLGELAILSRWMARYPQAVCSLTHGFPWRAFLEGDRLELPEAIWEPFAHPNLQLEVCFPVRLGDLFDYPYREVWPTLAELAERIGAERLLWGTDMPFQNRFCTYRQSRAWIERYCDFFSPEEIAQIMGGTAARLLRL